MEAIYDEVKITSDKISDKEPEEIVDEIEQGVNTSNAITPPKIKGILIKDLSKKKLLKVAFVRNEVDLPIVDGQFDRTVVAQYCDNLEIKLRIINDRVYPYVSIYDIQNDDYIGTIAYNVWKGYKSNTFHFDQPGENCLEIRDAKNKVALLMWYINDHLCLAGYFTDPGSDYIFIMPNDHPYSRNGDITKLCIKKSGNEWKKRAYEEVSHILSLEKAFRK